MKGLHSMLLDLQMNTYMFVSSIFTEIAYTSAAWVS